MIIKTRVIILTLAIGITLLTTGCGSSEPDYPLQLVQADSAYVSGNYELADSLLSSCPPLAGEDEAVGMYRQLVELEQSFVRGQLTEQHFSVADSLCRYYNKQGIQDKYAKALLFVGEVYRMSEAYPEALDCYMKAEEQVGDNPAIVKGWLYHKKGDMYFSQGMYDECTSCYRKFYNIAVSHNDRLRMAYGSTCMGKVCTIENDVDSTIYYYKQAIELSRGLQQQDIIGALARNNLCDIYIQIEEYDSAVAIMPYNSQNDFNRAYWHYGQNHVDSAICYFQKTLGRYKWQGETEALKILVELEKSKGNQSAALAYSEWLSEANDSLKLQSQVEETRKANAQHEYNRIKQKRDDEEKRSRKFWIISLSINISLVVFIIMFFVLWKSQMRRHEEELVRERRLKEEQIRIYKRSQQQIDENKAQMALLEQQLEQAKLQNDIRTVESIRQRSDLLTAENQDIEAEHQRREECIRKFKDCPLYERIKTNAGKSNYRLSDDEWEQLKNEIDEAYDHFTLRLLSIARMTETELHACYLMKLELSPNAMATILCKSNSAVSMLRSRLYKKITGQMGTPKQLDDFIAVF